MKRHVFVLFGLGIALCLMSGRVFAQVAGSIRGLVTDRVFGDRPLGGVTVLVVQTEQTTLTDDLGVYLVQNVPPGTYTLILTKDGFTRQVQANVTVSSGQLTESNVSMPSEFTELDPFVVQDLKLDAGSEIGLIELRQELPQFLDSVGEDQLSAAGVSDAEGALSLVSGATTNDGKAVIRGLPDRYVNSQVNGVRFPSADAETRSLELDQFPTDVIESIQVSKTFTPDQQGDASGGAVNIVLKGIPDEDVIKFGLGTEYNTNYTGKDDFRTYADGGVDTFGINKGRRQLPTVNPGPVALGTTQTTAPYDYSGDFTIAKRYEFKESGWTIGGVVNTFYDHGGSFYDDGIDQDYVADFVQATPVTDPGAPRRLFFLPDVGGTTGIFQVDPRSSNVFDIVKSTEEVQWGGLGAFGAKNEFNSIDLIFLQTRTTKDTTVVATDTYSRGIIQDEIDALQTELDPADFGALGTTPPDSTGEDLAFVRNQTLQYQERKIRSVQLRGKHTLPLFEDNVGKETSDFRMLPPVFDWTYARSSSTLTEPDQRFFREFYNPDQPSQRVFANNFNSSDTVGYAQRSWEGIREASDQVQGNLKLPFVLTNNEEGSLKVGVFRDRVIRDFQRETFTTDPLNQAPPFEVLPGATDFRDFFLTDFLTPGEATVNLADPTNDVDFTGNYDIDAYYWMLDIPVTPKLRVIGGLRFETTTIGIALDPNGIDEFAQALNISANSADPLWANFNTQTRAVNPATGQFRGDVDYQQEDILPSITFIYEFSEAFSVRGAYSETIARSTFRELTVIRQQEFLGSEQFFGNEELKFASVKNYDLRADYRPNPGGLISGSLFYKDIKDPIEYIAVTGNNVFAGSLTYPVNFPEGSILGGELEVRQNMGDLFAELTGLTLGANATIIESEVIAPANQATVPIGQTSREMLNAPEHLFNLFAVFRNEDTGTEIGLFYTVKGDTLVRGASPATTDISRFTPNIFETQYDTLNLTFSQKLSKHLKLKISAKNLTDPDIQQVYRSPLTPEVVHTSYNKGISVSVSLSATFVF